MNQTGQRIGTDLMPLKKLAKEDRIGFKKHALLRLYQRKILIDEVKEALIRGEVIESYASDKPLPSLLVLGYTSAGRPLHVVVALKMAWIITAYQPSKEIWDTGFRKRRKEP